MKSLNRTLSLVLVLVMVLGLIGVAGAADFKDQKDIKNAEAVNTMAALNIINGKDGNVFDPAGQVTRGEMAKMICVALNGGKAPVLGTTVNPTYTDIKGHWAAGYIEYCSSLGIVAGVGDGTFAPDLAVTGSQAAKMMLVAMNYNATVFGFTGATWENSVNVAANKAGLYNDLAIDASAPLSRDNAAQLIYNGIFANMMEIAWVSTSNGMEQQYRESDDTIASEKFGLCISYGTITNFKYDSVDKEYDNEYTEDETATADTEEMVETSFATAADYSAYFGMNVKVLFSKKTNGNIDTVYGVYPNKSTVVFAGVVGQLADSNIETQLTASAGGDTTVKSIKYNSTTYKFDDPLAAVPVDEFNTATTSNLATFFTTAANPDLSAGGKPFMAAYTFKAIDNDGDGAINKIVVYPFEVYEVTYVGTKTASISHAVVGTARWTDNSISLADDVVPAGLAADTWVKKTPAANTVTDSDTYEVITAMSGKVTKTATESGMPKATINGIKFVDLTGNNMAVGNTYSNIIQINTFMYASELGEGVASAKDYAVVVGIGTDLGVNKARLLFSDGTTEAVTTKEAYAEATYEGELVTYKKTSNGKYELALADYAIGNYDGDIEEIDDYESAAFNATDDVVEVSDDSPAVIATFKIASDAVVFVLDNDGAYKVITGAQFAKLSSVDTINNAYYKTNSTTKYSNIALAYITLGAGVTVGDNKYGILVEAPAELEDSLYEVVYWNGTENVTATASEIDSLNKGGIFAYTLDEDGHMVLEDISATKSAITAYDDASGDITIAGATYSDEVDKEDTTILYFDFEETEGVAGGKIRIYDGTNDNCYFYDGAASGDAFRLIVVDTNNNLGA